MIPKGLLVPIGILAAVIVAAGATAGLLSAANFVPYTMDRPVEIGVTPQDPEADPTPVPVVKVPAELSELNKEDALFEEGYEWAVSKESLPSSESQVYTWREGDRTMRVVLQDDLVIKSNAVINSLDDVVVRRTNQSIVRSQPWHEGTGEPVFRLESGGGLMTLPGGVLLALDPSWEQDKVIRFFQENGILLHDVTELDFLENSFMVETLSGFPALDRANTLAQQDGVVAASPNWARGLELK